MSLDQQDSALIRGLILMLSPNDGMTAAELQPRCRRMDLDRIKELCNWMAKEGLVIRIDRKCRATRKTMPAYRVR